jgi:phosphoserine aminotransferase
MVKSEAGKLVTDILLTSEEVIGKLREMSMNAIHVARVNFTTEELSKNEDYNTLSMLTMGLEILSKAVQPQGCVTP